MKPLLVVVDVQKDFMLPTGSLYVKDAEKIIPNIKNLIEDAKADDMNILYTSDYHYTTSKELSDTPNFTTTFPPHCIRDTEGVLLVDEINDTRYTIDWEKQYSKEELTDLSKNKELLLLKDEFDMFTNKNTDNLIQILKPSEILICGVVEAVCVKHAVEGFVKRGFKVSVFEDCIKNLEHLPSCLEDWDAMGVSIRKNN